MLMAPLGKDPGQLERLMMCKSVRKHPIHARKGLIYWSLDQYGGTVADDVFSYSKRPEYCAYIKIHYSDVIMGSIASQITSLKIVYSSVYSGADQRKHQSYAPLAFVRGIHRWPVNSPNKGPVTRKNASIWWRHHAFVNQLRMVLLWGINIGLDNGFMHIRPQPII